MGVGDNGSKMGVDMVVITMAVMMTIEVIVIKSHTNHLPLSILLTCVISETVDSVPSDQ